MSPGVLQSSLHSNTSHADPFDDRNHHPFDVMSTVTPLRLLVSGHVNSNVHRLLERVSSLSKKTEFDALLVAGDLFPASAGQEPVDTEWMNRLMNDDDVYQHLPTSVYVFGPQTEYQRRFFRQMMKLTPGLESGEVNEEELFSQGFDALNGRITVLGQRGVMNCSTGLTIVYFRRENVNDIDVEQFITTVTTSTSSSIDLFLSAVWPKNIHTCCTVPIPDPVVSRSNAGSDLISRIINRLKPRYIFTASEPGDDSSDGIFFERQPYRNHTVLKEQLKPVTRFVSLAAVSLSKKGPKWLYAFNLKPAAALLKFDKETGRSEGRTELCHQPDDTTESPFKNMILNYGTANIKTHGPDDVQFFFRQQQQQHHSGRRQGGDSRQREQYNNNGNNRSVETEAAAERPVKK